jgi:hypothetical protein
MTIPPRSPGGKPVTRALIAALEESAPGADAPNLRRIGDNLIGKAPTAAGAGTGTEEPMKVVFRSKGDD